MKIIKKDLFYWIVVIVFIIGMILLISNQPEVTPPSQPMPEGRIIINQSGGSSLLISECGDRNYITDTADYIVEGTVLKVDDKDNYEEVPGKHETRKMLFTYTDFLPEKFVKGELSVIDWITIRTEGGIDTKTGLRWWVEDQPIFHEGKKVRIYFKKEINDELWIVCGEAGIEEI